MADVPSEEALGRYLTLIALFGCARRDAGSDVAKVRDLKRAADLLRGDTPLDRIVKRVFAIMGPGWNPRATGGGWGKWMQTLLDERPKR